MSPRRKKKRPYEFKTPPTIERLEYTIRQITSEYSSPLQMVCNGDTFRFEMNLFENLPDVPSVPVRAEGYTLTSALKHLRMKARHAKIKPVE